MQNAKDTFYETLRTRLAALNPQRTIIVRGVLRPALLVEENELVSAFTPADCFRLRWTKATANPDNLLPVLTQQCEINYETAGTTEFGGMDRGRVLAAMDAELLALVNTGPRSAPKLDYSGLGSNQAAAPLLTSLWWSELLLGPAQIKQNRVARTATLNVMCYQEAGER